MTSDPLISLIFICTVMFVMYIIGLVAGRRLEREIEQDKIIAKRLAEEAKKNARRRR